MAILRDNGRIWSNIHIRGQDLAMLNAQITRSREAPLFVLVNVPPRHAARHPNYLDLQTNIKEAVNLILQRRDQVQRLEVRMDCQTLQQQFGCEWSNLDEIVWVDMCPPDSNVHRASYANLRPGGLSRLKILSLEKRINWPMNVVTQLTTFKLKGPMGIELTTLVEFLRRNLSLESLELTDVDVRRPLNSKREEPIELPHLTQLSVHKGTCGSALSLLNLPSLKRLWAFSFKDQNTWSDYDWSKLCSRLPIANLEVQYNSSIHERIMVVGSSELGTQSLRLAEFSPTTKSAALFGSLSNAPFPSVTSVCLIKNMPEEGVSPSLTTAICRFLGQLPRVERMQLRPNGLADEVVRCLSDNSELCPELRELEVTASEMPCKRAVELVAEVVKARASYGGGRKMGRIGYLHPPGSQLGGEVKTRRMWSWL